MKNGACKLVRKNNTPGKKLKKNTVTTDANWHQLFFYKFHFIVLYSRLDINKKKKKQTKKHRFVSRR